MPEKITFSDVGDDDGVCVDKNRGFKSRPLVLTCHALDPVPASLRPTFIEIPSSGICGSDVSSRLGLELLDQLCQLLDHRSLAKKLLSKIWMSMRLKKGHCLQIGPSGRKSAPLVGHRRNPQSADLWLMSGCAVLVTTPQSLISTLHLTLQHHSASQTPSEATQSRPIATHSLNTHLFRSTQSPEHKPRADRREDRPPPQQTPDLFTRALPFDRRAQAAHSTQRL